MLNILVLHNIKIIYKENKLDRIASFTINHIKLLEGLYVSRLDTFGSEFITTFDIRMFRPNRGTYLSTPIAHCIEHLGATFLRNHNEIKNSVVYFGPMGCRTGFYLLLHNKYSSKDILPLMIELFDFVVSFEGEVPGASEVECGNYKDIDLEASKIVAKTYLEILKNITEDRLIYPN